MEHHTMSDEETVAVRVRPGEISGDGGGYVHRTSSALTSNDSKPTARSQNRSVAESKNIICTTGKSVTSLERYRMAMDACKSRKRDPGFLKKAVFSMRNFQDVDADNDPLTSKLYLKPTRSNNVETLIHSSMGDLQKDDEEVQDKVKGLFRSSSTGSLAGSKNTKYNRIFKKAVNMVTISSLLATGTQSKDPKGHRTQKEDVPFADKEEKNVEGDTSDTPGHEASKMLTITDERPSIQDSVFNISPDNQDEMTIEDLKRIIFQSPNDMSVGDLKQLIVEKGGNTSRENLSTRPRSLSQTRRRCRSDSRDRLRMDIAPAVRSTEIGTQMEITLKGSTNSNSRRELRRHSLGRRQVSDSALDHNRARRQRRAQRKSSDGDDSTSSLPAESCLFTEPLRGSIPDSSRQRSISRRRSSGSSHSVESWGGERRRHSRGPRRKDCPFKSANSLKDLMTGLAVALDQETDDLISKLGSESSTPPF
jgi:hypothetical protein